MRDLFRGMGWTADRVWGSGSFKAAGPALTGDVDVVAMDLALKAEVKVRKGDGGWKTIERWLQDVDFLALKRDRTDPLLVIPWAVLRRILLTYEEHGATLRQLRLDAAGEGGPCEESSVG